MSNSKSSKEIDNKIKNLNIEKKEICSFSLLSEGETEWWFDAREITDSKVLEEAERSNCTHILVKESQLKSFITKKIKVAHIKELEELEGLTSDIWVMAENDEIKNVATNQGFKSGRHILIQDLEKEFSECIRICERGDDFVIVNIEHATYIPYELLIAKTQSGKPKVIRPVPITGLKEVVSHVDQSLNAFSTMEKGISVLFSSNSQDEIKSLTKNLISRQQTKIDLLPAEVVEVTHTGLGHRVCVDTTSMMSADEGILVGSTGWGGIIVSSETHYLPHMNLREFRVNAGAVHSYVWSKDGTTIYLSELEAGSEVLCVNKKGEARIVTVGRAKIERRPLLKVKCRVSIDSLPLEVKNAAINDFL